VRSSNPVLTRLTANSYRGSTATVPPPSPWRSAPSGYSDYPPVIAPAAQADRMTVDDVVVRTVGLLLLTAASATLAWNLVPDGLLFPVLVLGSIGGLILGLVIAFGRLVNPIAIGAYALLEGTVVGLFSKVFAVRSSGIVIQAIIGTFGVFAIMAALYKFRVIRATPRFTRGVIGALTGVLALIVVNFLLSLFGVQTGLRGGPGGGGALAIGFSLVVIVVAALTFILDFDQIEQGVRAGLPRQAAWICAFGLLVGLIWVYLEVLRLLSYLNRR
jgi:uncharacterized YccA/Bax inhibitor family protein